MAARNKPSPETLRALQKTILAESNGMTCIELYRKLRDAAGLTDQEVHDRIEQHNGKLGKRNSLNRDLKSNSYYIIKRIVVSDALALRSGNAQDPQPDQNADGEITDETGASLRHLLFAKAGHIEVTPKNIALWNEEVLAGFKRRFACQPDVLPRPTLSNLFKKIASFQEQQHSLRELYEAAPCVSVAMPLTRFTELLQGGIAPLEHEIPLLCTALHMEDHQACIMEYVENKSLPNKISKIETSFSRIFKEIAEDLQCRGHPHSQLEGRGKEYSESPGYAGINNMFSKWKNGEVGISVPALRTLVAVLDRLSYNPQKINELISAVELDGKPLNRERLFETASQAVESLQPDAHPSFRAFIQRLAGAIDVSANEQRIFNAMTAAEQELCGSPVVVNMWLYLRQENPRFPDISQLRAVLAALSRISLENGGKGLTEDHMDRVVALLEHERKAEIPKTAAVAECAKEKPESAHAMEAGKPATWSLRFAKKQVETEFKDQEATFGLKL